FAPAGDGSLPPVPGPLGAVSLGYTDTSKHAQSDQLDFPIVPADKLPLGLARGLLLVDEITTLKQASVLHGQQTKTEEAYRLVRALDKKLNETHVSGLEKERELVDKFDATLTHLSGHQGEPGSVAKRDALSGLPTQ